MPEQTFSPPFAEQVREQHRSVVAALANLDALFSKLKGHLSTYASMNREAEINYIVSQDAQFFRYIEPNAPYGGETRRDNADSRLKRFSIMLCASYPISRVDIQAYKGAEKSIFDYDVSPYINLTKNTDICDLYESYFAYLRRAQYIQIERGTPLYKSPDENYSRIPLKQDSVSYSIPFYILPSFSAVVIEAFPRKKVKTQSKRCWMNSPG